MLTQFTASVFRRKLNAIISVSSMSETDLNKHKLGNDSTVSLFPASFFLESASSSADERLDAVYSNKLCLSSDDDCDTTLNPVSFSKYFGKCCE